MFLLLLEVLLVQKDTDDGGLYPRRRQPYQGSILKAIGHYYQHFVAINCSHHIQRVTGHFRCLILR